MKAILLALIISMFSISGFAQSKNDLKGPAAKNYKPWKADLESISIVTVSQKTELMGPNFKNQKPWSVNSDQVTKTQVIFSSNRKGLKGPAAKNYKPWNN